MSNGDGLPNNVRKRTQKMGDLTKVLAARELLRAAIEMVESTALAADNFNYAERDALSVEERDGVRIDATAELGECRAALDRALKKLRRADKALIVIESATEDRTRTPLQHMWNMSLPELAALANPKSAMGKD
jgi:hypothetical protein